MDPLSLHLTDKGTKPVHALPYTVPRSVEQQLHAAYGNCKISEHEIGVLEEDYTSEWASPTFAIAK
jgi:hypothetical protein